MKRKFGMADKLGYMFGDFGNDFAFILSSMFLLKFYTDVMGVSAAVVGTMMMAARLLDAFTDVTMGQIADRSRGNKKGKFAPWLLRMCGPVAVSSFLMYASWFAEMPMTFKIIWMFFTYLLWGSVFYTAINIPYGSMASAISAEPKDRTALSNWRTIGATLAATVIGVVLPLVVYYTDENGNAVLSGTRMSIAAFWCSVGSVICYLLCYFMVTERVKAETTKQKFSFMGLIGSLIQNRALIGIVVSALLLLLSQLSLSNMGAYIYPNYFGDVKGLSLASLIGTVYFVHTKNVYVWLIFYGISYIGLAMFNLVCWAMITDVIDDTQVRTGQRPDGTIYAVYSFARKLGQAASSGLVGVLLSVIGYNTATAYDEKVVNGIYTITCIVPAAGFVLLALSLWFLYPLGKTKVEENARILKERRDRSGM